MSTLARAKAYKGKPLVKSATGRKYYVTEGGNRVYVTAEMIEKARAEKATKKPSVKAKKVTPAKKASASTSKKATKI